MAGGVAGGRCCSREAAATADVVLRHARWLLERGSASRVLVRRPDGGTVIALPLNVGAAVATALLLLHPRLSAVAAGAALLAAYRVEIVPAGGPERR